MTITRRSFLKTLGIAASGIAFAPSLDFLIPDNIVSYDGAPNLRWLLAESIAALAEGLPERQFRHVAHPAPLAVNQHLFGIHMEWPDDLFERDKNYIRQCYLEPAMNQMAQQILYLKPRTCLALELPEAVEQAARVFAPKHGLDLRFIRAWDTGRPEFESTDEETGECRLYPAEEPRWISRFDMAVA